jgi:hypothetical protein
MLLPGKKKDLSRRICLIGIAGYGLKAPVAAAIVQEAGLRTALRIAGVMHFPGANCPRPSACSPSP